MKIRVYTSIIAVSLLTVISFNVQAQDEYKVDNTFHVGGGGRWDYIANNNGLLYIAHGTEVNVLDASTGDSISVIPNTTGVHGIAFVPELNKGYTSNGGLDNVTVFDLVSQNVLSHISTDKGPDAITYDRYTKKIITCNGHGHSLSIIDPFTEKVVATIQLGGKPETAVSDEKGKLYVNIEDKNEIAVIDLKSYQILARWPLKTGESPSGLAIDKATMRLFSVCDNKTMVVMNANDGSIISSIPIGDGPDGAAFDPGTKTIFSSNGDGTLTIVKELAKDKYKVLQNLKTKKGARTITVDERSHSIYLPTADFDESNAQKGKREPVKAGSFQVLVIKGA